MCRFSNGNALTALPPGFRGQRHLTPAGTRSSRCAQLRLSDLADAARVRELVDGVDAIVHFAG